MAPRAIHERTILRRQVVDALAALEATYHPRVGAPETFVVTVLDAPTIDMWVGDLPAVAVYVVSERSEGRAIEPGSLNRTAQVQINIGAKEAHDLHGVLDAIALAVEARLSADVEVATLDLVSTTLGRTEEARLPSAFLTMNFDARFQTDQEED